MNVTAIKTQQDDNFCMMCCERTENTYEVTLRRRTGDSVIGFCCCDKCLADMQASLTMILRRKIEGSVACLRETCKYNTLGVCTCRETKLPYSVVKQYDACPDFILKEIFK